MRKLLLSLGALLISVGVVTGLPGGAQAGGWAVISLDSAPEVAAGEDTEIGFTVLRHGVTPESSEDVSFLLTGPDGSQRRFAAVPEGRVGHHVVTITAPSSGTYTWTVEGPFVPVELGSLDVVAAGGAGASRSWAWDAAPWTALGLAVVLAGLAVLDSVRRRGPAVPPVATVADA